MSVTVLAVPAREAAPLEGDLTLEALPGRDLDEAELRALASSIALQSVCSAMGAPGAALQCRAARCCAAAAQRAAAPVRRPGPSVRS